MGVASGAGSAPSRGPPSAAAIPPVSEGRLEVRTIAIADVFACLEEGVRDFTHAPLYGMFFGAIYAIGGLLTVWLTFAYGYFYLAYPIVMGFALLAPFGAAGTYEISRRLESGAPLSWPIVIGAVWGRAGKELGWLALVSLFTFVIWLDLAVFVFLVFFGVHVPSPPELLAQVFTTPSGIAFLAAGNGLGAIVALAVFSFTAVSPPLVVDRDVDFLTALATSVKAVLANPRPMLAWATVIGAGLAVAFVSLFVALVVVFPVFGHTTWRLYRRLIA